eukprot:768177-Hanusia_phi.AAC.2
MSSEQDVFETVEEHQETGSTFTGCNIESHKPRDTYMFALDFFRLFCSVGGIVAVYHKSEASSPPGDQRSRI